MKKRLAALCAVMVAFSVAFAVAGTGVTDESKSDISTAKAKVYAAENDESTTSSIAGIVGDAVSGIGSGASGALGDVVSNVVGGIGSDSNDGSLSSGGLGDILGGIGSDSDSSGGLGDILGGIGSGSSGGLLDSFGNVLGGLIGSDSSGGTTSVTYDVGYITPIPAATQNLGQSTVTQAVPQTAAPQASVAGSDTTAAAAVSSNPYQKPTGEFKSGDEGDAIKWMQWIFANTGYGLTEDGITGVFDDATLALVKKLQQEKGLTADGVVNDEVINQIELLYYEKLYGVETTAPIIPSIGTYETAAVSTDNGKNNSAVWIIVIVLAVIWIIAIGIILVLFFLKKKKTSKSAETSEKNADEKVNTEANKKEADGMSISDLFEEANKK